MTSVTTRAATFAESASPARTGIRIPTARAGATVHIDHSPTLETNRRPVGLWAPIVSQPRLILQQVESDRIVVRFRAGIETGHDQINVRDRKSVV